MQIHPHNACNLIKIVKLGNRKSMPAVYIKIVKPGNQNSTLPFHASFKELLNIRYGYNAVFLLSI